MSERSSHGTQRVLRRANQEAVRLRHNYVGTEHLLLAVVVEREGTAGRLLDLMAVSAEKVREQIEQLVGPGEEPVTGTVPWTPRAQRVVDLAEQEAGRVHSDVVRTQHLLAGLLLEGEGLAVQVLQNVGVDPRRLRERILQLSASSPSDG